LQPCISVYAHFFCRFNVTRARIYFVLQGKGETQPLTIQAPHNLGMPILMLHRNETVWDDPAVR